MKLIDLIKDIFVYDSSHPLLFNSGLFLGLFLAFYAIYIAIRKEKFHKLRILYVIAFSLFFYYKCSGIYFLLLIFSSIVDYYIGQALSNVQKQSYRKLLLWLSIAVNLGLLGYFKYTNFFIDNINGITGADLKPLDIFLPIGISFYTFQTMSYSIDLYRRKIEPARNFWDFLFFVSFFPQLVAGPIVRAAQFIPQISKEPKLSHYGLDKALLLIMGGLFKKAVISDYISINFVDRVFDNPQLYSAFENLMAVYGYAAQIYCDFSGYSDMAIGLGLLLGFRLPINFRSPYQSTSITEFWRRWHISLSSWLKDYLYISLGGNRKGAIRTYVNLFLVMFLGGLWHGAAWKFAVWGMLHGVLLAIERFFGKMINLPKSRARSFIGWLFTFHFVLFAWIFFRASDYDTAMLLIGKIGDLFTDQYAIGDILYSYRFVFALLIISFGTHLMPNRDLFALYTIYRKAPLWLKAIGLGILIWVVYLTASSDVQPFIYFQF
ncbi:D-alanyl-lipoteichoic acid acyltransferase DltB (MBOAT superfamily) [Balneicella halophila]|uniref:D-alanyl-lipoteichoic acid acyltransferase DltB (MBOAT superfamily) n=1 Tax=Balneicella halophila TaxID=1537566 RepID=A0A7L4USA1_BALHA|nr:MBOAT family O-acyltransferase [Balneicella halophila]PVX52640.1 D-alanyl-lipoteichoic acid acyltransferase DltB (MBOAT superfamily) [Balneicella halophila]